MSKRLHIRAFIDSNADRIGDFSGLIKKMDYLQDLGVPCWWLLPFFPFPLRMTATDISDYLNVHPMYGTLDNFREFLDAAHDRGRQVMIGLVVNHTSGANFSYFAQPVDLNLPEAAGAIPVETVGYVELPPRRAPALSAHFGPLQFPVARTAA